MGFTHPNLVAFRPQGWFVLLKAYRGFVFCVGLIERDFLRRRPFWFALGTHHACAFALFQQCESYS